MRRITILCSLLLLTGLSLSAATLDEARRLHEAGQSDQALSIIEGLLDSATTAETAAALDLLGSIAVDKGYLSMARQAWTRLIEEYPEYAAANDVRTKLSLVSALLKVDEGAQAAPPASVPEPTPAAAAAPVEAPPAATPEPQPAPEPSSEPVSEPPSPQPVAGTEAGPVTTPQEAKGLVLVASRGRPYDAVVETNQRIVAFLRERGVDAVSSTGDVPVVESSTAVLPFLLKQGQEDGAGSVLLVTADYMRFQKVAGECYLPAGAELWKVKTTGGTGKKGRPYSANGVTESLLERFLEKLEEKIGGPGLPVTLR